ncbi:XdhC family protein [bacterium]|nr:XdhC family protein [bacterium]
MEIHNQQLYPEITRLIATGHTFAVATIVDATPGTPGRTGFKLVYLENGETKGTVGGGELEYKIISVCAEAMKTKESQYVEFNLAEDLGMACGGEVRVFVEYFAPIKTAYLFGAGHMGRSLSPMLKSIGFKVVVVDNRPEYAIPEEIPSADSVLCTDYLTFAESFEPNESDSVVIFTYGHQYDYDIINIVCKRGIKLKYVGLIGSKSKVKLLLSKIKDFNYVNSIVDSVYSPVGLNIATRTTPEIALAIAAEMLAVYNGVEKVDFMKNK